MEAIPLAITGMRCGHCVAGVRRALAAVPGVQVQDIRIGGATVTAAVPAAALVAAVQEDRCFADVMTQASSVREALRGTPEEAAGMCDELVEMMCKHGRRSSDCRPHHRRRQPATFESCRAPAPPSPCCSTSCCSR